MSQPAQTWKWSQRRSRSGSARKGAPGSALRPSSHVHNVKERGAGTGAVSICVRAHARSHGITMGRTVELFMGWTDRQTARVPWHRVRPPACRASLNRAPGAHETSDTDRRVYVCRLGLRTICPPAMAAEGWPCAGYSGLCSEPCAGRLIFQPGTPQYSRPHANSCPRGRSGCPAAPLCAVAIWDAVSIGSSGLPGEEFRQRSVDVTMNA
jgi:hypothetical protein